MRAFAFDFNGTLSDDEPVLARVYVELVPGLTAEEYFTHLAGHTDEEILGPDPQLIAERVRRYNEIVADGSTIGEETRAAVRRAAERVPVAVVSSAYRAEIEPVRRLGSASRPQISSSSRTPTSASPRRSARAHTSSA
jgi:beta-phosphoglucomutase